MKILLAFVFLVTFSALADFQPSCKIPFESIKKHHPIDDECGHMGKTRNTGNQAQNNQKNNLCVKSEPISIEYRDFITLQERVAHTPFKFGKRIKLNSDRSLLQNFLVNGKNFGENSVVSLKGYLVAPHYSDLGKGETVNCNKPNKEENDIHFSISPDPIDLPPSGKIRTARLCSTVTGEIIPHLRPAEWEVSKLKLLAKAKLPVRVTGHLFFDSSHDICREDGTISKENPPRLSLWEIHPVYKIEVCPIRKLSDCTKTSWLALEKWIH